MLVRAQFLRGMNYFDEKYGQFGSNLQLFAQIRTAAKRIVILTAARAISAEGEGLWKPADTRAKAELCADYAAGLIRFARYFGMRAALRMRARILAGALLAAAAALIRFGDFGGAKIDGSQTGL